MSIHIKDSGDLKTRLGEAGDKLVVIDFMATWCGPCKMIGPKLDEMATEMADSVVVLKDKSMNNIKNCSKRGNGYQDESTGVHWNRQSRGRRRCQRGRRGGNVLHTDDLVDVTEQMTLCRFVTQTRQAITLSITTRGIGLALCYMTFWVQAYDTRIFVPNIYAMYRAFLGILEKKLQQSGTGYVSRVTEHLYRYRFRSNNIIYAAPEPIRKIINAVGCIEYENKIYVPGVANDVYDGDQLVPRPETLLLSNLRRTVEALSNSATSIENRESFRRNCTIPGAIWDEQSILLNPDDIIPQDYNMDDDYNIDVMAAQSFVSALQRHVPSMAGGIIDFKSAGKLSLLVSNRMETLRVLERKSDEPLEEYCRRLTVHGNVREYFMLGKLSPEDVIEGQANLLGEYPDPIHLRYPVYHLRDEFACGHYSSSDYIAAKLHMYAQWRA